MIRPVILAATLVLAAAPAWAGWANGVNTTNGLGTQNGINTTNGLGTENGLNSTNGVPTTNGLPMTNGVEPQGAVQPGQPLIRSLTLDDGTRLQPSR